MARPQVFEGTAEEFANRIDEFVGMRLKVFAVPEEDELEEDESDRFPSPPTTVRDQAHLEALLLEAIASPKEEVTKQEWSDLRREVRERLAARKSSQT